MMPFMPPPPSCRPRRAQLARSEIDGAHRFTDGLNGDGTPDPVSAEVGGTDGLRRGGRQLQPGHWNRSCRMQLQRKAGGSKGKGKQQEYPAQRKPAGFRRWIAAVVHGELDIRTICNATYKSNPTPLHMPSAGWRQQRLTTAGDFSSTPSEEVLRAMALISDIPTTRRSSVCAPTSEGDRTWHGLICWLHLHGWFWL